MRTRFLLFLAVVAAVTLAMSGTAFAQAEPVSIPPGTPTTVVTGTVVSATASELVIETGTGRRRFMVDSNSTMPSGLVEGTRVSVEFHSLDGDRFHVARVTTRPASEAPRSDATALPSTASPLGTIALLGLVSLAGAAGLRARRRAA